MPQIAACWLSLALAAVATADTPTDVLSPYLDAQTLVVAHIDMSRVAVDPLIDSLNQLGKVDERATAGLRQGARRWIEDFTKAGGKDVYAIVNLADLPRTPFFIVPLPTGADAGAITRLLETGLSERLALGAPRAEVVEKRGDAVFAGSKAALARLRAAQPQPRPDVARAFTAAGPASLQVVLVPTADVRRVLTEVLPTLPRQLGGGSITTLTRGVQWAAAGADGPPQTSLRVVIQSQDAAAAEALRGLIGKVYDLLGRTSRVALPPLPQVDGDRLTLTLDTNTPDLGGFLAGLAGKMTDAASRQRCMNNLKQIGLALHTYHDVHNHFPAVANFDDAGKPLLSWRVHLLPFLGQETLYKEFHLNEPWDSVHNKTLIERMPEVYRCPAAPWGATGKTTFLAPVGKELMFTGDVHGVPIKEVTDGTSNTIFVVDAADDHAVVWTKPDDLRVDAKEPLAGLVGHHAGGFNAVFVDGSAHFISRAIDPKMLFAVFTRNGGEVIALP
jgi:hypothetical protein